MPGTGSIRISPDTLSRMVARHRDAWCVVFRERDGSHVYLIMVAGHSRRVTRTTFEREARAMRRDALNARFRAAGFRLEGTGGGCEAWVMDVPGAEIVVTREEDPSIPTDPRERVDVGMHNVRDDDTPEWAETMDFAYGVTVDEALRLAAEWARTMAGRR